MRILYISKYPLFEETILNQLLELAERDSIVFEYSFESARLFIENHIEKDQVPLDIIICYSKIQGEESASFRDYVRSATNRTYSSRDFNLKEIPLVLLVGKNENKQAFKGYDFVIEDAGPDKVHLFVTDFNSKVRSWRVKVLDELDSLGIKFNSGIIDYSYYFSSKRKKKNIQTSILSDNFQLLPRRLNYHWLELNKKQIEESIDSFIKLLKRTNYQNKKREEKLYHKFFKQHDHFLLRDNYTRFWYESQLSKEDGLYEEPDFSLKPNFSYYTDLSVLEVKLPNERFIKKKKYHPSPKSSLIDHIIQVNDYKDYLESEQYKEEIHRVFGYIPSRVEYNLLIGRNEDKYENITSINKVMRQLGQGHLNLMTYDELKDYQVKFLERMEIIEVR